MKSPALLLAELHRRDLFDAADRIAIAHHVTLADVLIPSHLSEVVRARHAIWVWQISELGTVSAVARLWGVDRSALLAANQAKSPIAFVLLGDVKEPTAYRFSYFSRHPKPFAITNLEHDHTTWFGSYEEARRVWQQVLDLEGHTFRAVSAAPAVAEGGA